MISSQVIQKTLDELRSITRIDLCVMDVDGKVNSTTFPIEDEFTLQMCIRDRYKYSVFSKYISLHIS